MAAFAVVALVLSGVAFVLTVVGLAIPFWLHYGSDLVSVNLGLWSVCVSALGQVECQSFTDFGFGSSENKYLNAARGMEIIAMILFLGALICHILKKCVMRQAQNLPKVSGIVGILGGVFGIVGCIVFAAKFGNFQPAGSAFKLKLHAGFALCIIASLKGIVSGVLSFLIRDD